MEELKKTIKQALTISGGTAGSYEFKIIPDTGATYYMKISLTQEIKSLGFFNSFVEPEETFNDNVFEWIPLIPNEDFDPQYVILTSSGSILDGGGIVDGEDVIEL